MRPKPSPKGPVAPARRTPSRFPTALAALAAFVWIAYANSLGLGLAMDARAIIPNDPRIRVAAAQNAGLILRTDYWWPSSVDRLYRPLTTTSFLFNYAVLGGGPQAAAITG